MNFFTDRSFIENYYGEVVKKYCEVHNCGNDQIKKEIVTDCTDWLLEYIGDNSLDCDGELIDNSKKINTRLACVSMLAITLINSFGLVYIKTFSDLVDYSPYTIKGGIQKINSLYGIGWFRTNLSKEYFCRGDCY